MARAIDKWSLRAGTLLIVCALVACKKKETPAPEAQVTGAAEQAAAASAAVARAAAAASAAQAAAAATASSVVATAPVASVATDSPALGAVKRFPGKEKLANGTTKILLADSKIYDEPDATRPSVASLPKDLVVTRLAALDGDWVLIEFPSGVGKVSPGWIQSKSLVAAAASTKPATSASAAASAKPAASAVATASPAPSASAPPVRIKPGVLRAPGR